MPVDELRGRAVWTEEGERVGTLRGVETDADGRIVSLDVQERWILGKHHPVSADSMRMEGGDLVVPTSAVLDLDLDTKRRDRSRGAAISSSTGNASAAPVLLAGRTGARSRFGGVDVLGSMLGAFVAFAALVLVGGLLAAIFDTGTVTYDAGMSDWGDLVGSTLLVGAASIFIAFLVGGWAAGRASRFDGPTNGMLVTVWAVLFGLAFAGLGAWLGSEYDVLSGANIPQFEASDVALAGIGAAAVALLLMLLGGSLGGWIGERWHRRADRAMLDVVPVGANVGVDDPTREPSAAMPSDYPAVPHHTDATNSHDIGVMGTPAGSPIAPRSMPSTDSRDDITRPR